MSHIENIKITAVENLVNSEKVKLSETKIISEDLESFFTGKLENLTNVEYYWLDLFFKTYNLKGDRRSDIFEINLSDFAAGETIQIRKHFADPDKISKILLYKINFELADS